MRSPLTLLYVPGDRPDRVAKALASVADVVIIDLEDAVLAPAKEAARAGLAAIVTGPGAVRAEAGALQIRVNALGSSWADGDLRVVAELPAGVGVRVPKCEDPAVVFALVERLGGRAAHALVESALGLEVAFELSRSGVASIGPGEADLRADLGVSHEEGLTWARSRLVNAAAAAGLPPPSMSVFTEIGDLDGLRRSCDAGRRLGFRGRTALHPSQLAVIDEVFSPTETELSWAREVIARVETGSRDGSGAMLLPDGRFVDAAVVRQARRVLATERTGDTT